jgi:hypothetical protein
MRRAGVAATLNALVACTYPEKQFEGPYTCLGAPPPTSADMLVTIRGQTVNPSDLMPLTGVSLTLQDRNMSTISGPITTGAGGAFQFSLNTNGTPVDGVYLNSAASGRITTYYAPARPVTEDLQIGLAILSTMQADNLALGALGAPFTAGTGVVLLTVNDCNDKPIAGATLSSVPAGVVRYFDGIQPSMTATATDAGGVALVANLPPGVVRLTVTAGGMMFPARVFNVVADTFIQTVIQP